MIYDWFALTDDSRPLIIKQSLICSVVKLCVEHSSRVF